MIFYDQIYKFVKENYNYIYLRSQVENMKDKNVLITGTSHGLLGIDMYEMGLDNTINMCMHSQDLYYSLQSVKKIFSGDNCSFSRCLMILGYYIPFQDLFRAGNNASTMIQKVFYPLYKDDRCKQIKGGDPCEGLWMNISCSPKERNEVEECAFEMIRMRRQYICDLYCRQPYYKFDRPWRELDDGDKNKYGEKRAAQHNKHLVYRESYIENDDYMEEIKKTVHDSGAKLIVIVPPFTKAYMQSLNKELMTEGTAFLKRFADEIIDFNNDRLGESFTDEDFIDTDHLNGRGAFKFSGMIRNMI